MAFAVEANNVSWLDVGAQFTVPSNFTLFTEPQPSGLPNISNGTIWSNEVDTFWLYGGEAFANQSNANNIWRYQSNANGGTWSEIDSKAANLSLQRPTRGAGCNVPSRSIAYYLGGYMKLNVTGDGNSFDPQYLHTMTVFDMNTESTSIVTIPDYVPVVDPNLVYLDIGVRGALVVVGGQTESNGTLEMASSKLSSALKFPSLPGA